MRPEATRVRGLKLLVHEALSFDVVLDELCRHALRPSAPGVCDLKLSAASA
jgi:hypothetical protein